MPLWREEQFLALATLYYSTRGGDDFYEKRGFAFCEDQTLHNWMNAANNECSWRSKSTLSQRCTADGKYLHLDLAGSIEVAGTIPPEVSLLRSLNTFVMYNNYWSGTIPTQLGMPTMLQKLELSSLQLTGSIPT